MADDDEAARMMTRRALKEVYSANDMRFVRDGEELMDYLHRRGKYAYPAEAPRPGLLLLDLKMPRKDGHEVLREIRADPNLRAIPVVVLTGSKTEEDIVQSHDLGVNWFITKPVDFPGLVRVMRAVNKYWLQIVEQPSVRRQGGAG
jgi:CheY-like chemotaxis protein